MPGIDAREIQSCGLTASPFRHLLPAPPTLIFPEPATEKEPASAPHSKRDADGPRIRFHKRRILKNLEIWLGRIINIL